MAVIDMTISMFKSNLVPLLFITISSIALLSVSFRMTKPLYFSIYLLVSIITITLGECIICTGFFVLLFGSIHLYFKPGKKRLKYEFKVMSILGIYNKITSKEDTKSVLIGNIFPMNEGDLRYNNKAIKMDSEVKRAHKLVMGASGSGKTEIIKSGIYQDLKNGNPVVLIDYKGEQDMIEELKEFANGLGIPTYEMSPYNVDFNYDPLMNLNNAGRVEAILNTRKWSMDGSDAHFRSGTQLLAQKLVSEYDKKWESEDKGKIPYTLGFYQFALKYPPSQFERDSYNNITKMLEILLTSDLSPSWKGEKEKEFSFEKREQYLVIFSFLSSNKELANSVSSFLFKDILDSANKKTFRPQLAVYIDEYGSLENVTIIKDIIEKGRSGGIEITVSLLDINQIIMSSSQAFLDSILGTLNTFIILAGFTRSTADKLGGVQLKDLEDIILKLRKPREDGKTIPTALYISKYPSINHRDSFDVYKFIPYRAHVKALRVANTNKPPINTRKNIDKPPIQNNPIDEVEIIEKRDPVEKVDFDSFI